jgi:transposase
VDQRNRVSQAEFRCIHCGETGHADLFAAQEIALRGRLVSRPNCSERKPLEKAPLCSRAKPRGFIPCGKLTSG